MNVSSIVSSVPKLTYPYSDVSVSISRGDITSQIPQRTSWTRVQMGMRKLDVPDTWSSELEGQDYSTCLCQDSRHSNWQRLQMWSASGRRWLCPDAQWRAVSREYRKRWKPAGCGWGYSYWPLQRECHCTLQTHQEQELRGQRDTGTWRPVSSPVGLQSQKGDMSLQPCVCCVLGYWSSGRLTHCSISAEGHWQETVIKFHLYILSHLVSVLISGYFN